MEHKKLYRTENDDRLVCGICGGIAEFFNLDPFLVRVIWVILSFFSGFIPGLLVYFICSFLLPTKSEIYPDY